MMERKKFKIGQSVTPIQGAPWHNINDEPVNGGPKFGEVYTVECYTAYEGQWFVGLVEYRDNYVYQHDLEAVIDSSVLEEELNEIEVGV